jgi:hypothetical protein
LLHGTLFSFSFFLFLHHFGIWVSLLLITCFCCVLFWFFFFFLRGVTITVFYCVWAGYEVEFWSVECPCITRAKMFARYKLYMPKNTYWASTWFVNHQWSYFRC